MRNGARRADMSSNVADDTMESRRVRRSNGMQRLDNTLQADDGVSTNEIMSRLNALAMDEEPARSRGNSSASQESQTSVRMPRPRPLSYHQSTQSPSSSFSSSTSTPVRRPLSPPSYNESAYSSSHSTPRIHAGPSAQAMSAPAMVRAHSSPISLSPTFGQTTARSASPLRSPNRVRSPFRPGLTDDAAPGMYSAATAALSPEIGSISEDAELEIIPRGNLYSASLSNPSATSPSLSFPRPLRRRPASPLRSFNASRASSVPASPHLSAVSSSASSDAGGSKFGESFPSDLPYYYQSSSRSLSISSSMPSTPTSVRSRSPSISSLETIPDSPDAEMMATEEDGKEKEERKRLWEQLYGSVPPASSGSDRAAAGSRNLGARDKRKRWSVCGAEKMSDLNLETIWED